MIDKILRNLKIEALNKMQEAALEVDNTRDLVLLAPTGSGKTLAFLLPLLQSLQASAADSVQALIIVPSRELALQIEHVFKQMGTGFKVNCCYGGHPLKTERNNFINPATVVIGTPGRMAYHVRRGSFNTATVKTLILDEFDKGLELGFQDDMFFIIANLPSLNRRILTSATAIEKLPSFVGLKTSEHLNFLNDEQSKPDLQLRTVMTKAEDKIETLSSLICMLGNKTMLVFCNHREAVERISEHLRYMDISHDIFHGGMEQDDREKALLKFRNGSHHILLTTDLASRGLDIPEIEFIIHYQIPSEEAFIHRNGRTARMKAQGTAYLLLEEGQELPFLKKQPELVRLPEQNTIPEKAKWTTLYFGGGKKEKINKVDIVGLLLKKGGLKKEEVGIVEVLDHASYAAIAREKLHQTLGFIQSEKVKNLRIKIEEAR